MTRAETLAGITRSRRMYNTEGDECACGQVPGCFDCTVGWLLQELTYQKAQLQHACDGRDAAIVQLREYVLENVRLRVEMDRVDAHHVAQYLAGRQ